MSVKHNNRLQLADMARDQRGFTLLEVLLSTVVLGIALTGFLMALSTATMSSRIASDESKLVHLAAQEFESLRAASFGEVPFLLTDEPGHLEEVPDYFNDLAILERLGGTVHAWGASGDLGTDLADYSRDFAFDGRRANVGTRWMGSVNALAYKGSGGPSAGGPEGGGPDAGGPSGGPGAGGEYAPDDYQYIFCAFPELTRICRILYDNRFNVTELIGVPAGDFDSLPHEDDVWQRNFDFFWSDSVLGYWEVYDPWRNPHQPLEFVDDQGYGSSGVWVIYEDTETPLEAGVIGVHNIDTQTDFDLDFHWPYASEIEVYGFSMATNYIEHYRSPTGEDLFDSVIMYFPDYLGSGFDLGRWSYVSAAGPEAARAGHKDLIHVALEFYPSSLSNRDETWQTVTWWRDDSMELARFQTSFYRDAPTRVDRLPNLRDFPTHLVYGDNEDLTFPFTVPGASEIRAHFGTFNLDPMPGTDTVSVEDIDGNVYMGPDGGNVFEDTWTPWVPGDTIVIHFESDWSGNSYDVGWRGFEIDEVEVRWVGFD